jgi:tetrahydromethanopterin S-methyltransferase subunit E
MKYRLIVNGVSFYTNDRQIDSGVGSDTTINSAVQVAKQMMGKNRGLSTTVAVYDNKMKRTSVDVQIDKL